MHDFFVLLVLIDGTLQLCYPHIIIHFAISLIVSYGGVDMDIRKIEYFLTVVKHLNFTRAANECHIAQTAMSRHISNLEDEIGVQLLYRDNRSVSLTAAGEIFYQHALNLVGQYHEMIHMTQTAAQELQPLRIGFGQYEHNFASILVKAFRELHPLVSVSVAQYHYNELLANLKSGKLDVIFSLPSGTECVSELETHIQPVCPSILHLIVSMQHPLATVDTMSVKEISEDTVFITLSEDSGPCALERLVRVAGEAGHVVKKTIRANSLESLLLMVESGLGAAFLPSICRRHIPPGIKVILLNDLEQREFVAMHQLANHNPAVNAFFSLLVSMKDEISERITDSILY